MKYRREIDGLRSVAVLPVIAFHGGLTWMSGGYVGVDVFFVISGYLITTILLSEIESGRFSLLRFYERRARRILPALFVVMAACLPFGWVWMLQTQFLELAEAIAATTLFVSNILYWTDAGYFAAAAEENPLLHTWSLAVEEQYFLLFPPTLALLMLAGRRTACAAIIAVSSASLCWAFLSQADQASKFYLTHFRIWELLTGSLCAFILQQRAAWSNDLLAAPGLACVVAPIFAFDSNTPFPQFSVLPVLGTVLILLFAGRKTWVARLLSIRGCVALGLISYSAYLWHQPLFAFARVKSVFAPPPMLMVVLAVLSLLLAWATWAWVEQPFRGQSPRALPRRGQVFLAALSGMAAFLGASLFVGEKDGVPGRGVVANLVPPLIDARAERFRTWDVLEGRRPARFALDRFDAPGAPIRLLVLGDSHSKGLFNAIYQNPAVFDGLQVRWLGLGFSCDKAGTAAEVETACLESRIEEHAALFDLATHILLAARWSTPEKLDRLAEYAKTLSGMGSSLMIAGTTQEYQLDAPDMILQVARDTGFDGKTRFPSERSDKMFHDKRARGLDAIDAQIRAIADSVGARFLDRRSLVCDAEAERCTSVTPQGHGAVYDYGHWTLEGARFFGKLIAERDWLQLR